MSTDDYRLRRLPVFMSNPRVTAVLPPRAIEAGRVTLTGEDLLGASSVPDVRVLDRPARVVFASSARVDVLVPGGITESGPLAVRIGGADSRVTIAHAAPLATGLHQVDNPAFDREGNLYVTYSGTRGQQVPVSIFRVRPNGTRETFSSGIVNPTSMAIDPQGTLFVSSRFEGVVYRVAADGTAETFATDLGVACGLAFAPDGSLFVGDRSGTIFKLDRSGRAKAFATLPSSVAAFHLALGADGLYVTGPTLSSYDAVYRVDDQGTVTTFSTAFGRPQGLAFDRAGELFVVEALAGSSGLYRVPPSGAPELVLSGPGLIGIAFDPHGTLVVCSNHTAYRLPQWG
jgi:sugar lactone lactonase YvrE